MLTILSRHDLVAGARARRRNEEGLSLVELIIAFALFGIILLGVVPLFLGSVKSNYSANEYTSIQMIARDRLEQLMSLPFGSAQLAPGVYANDLPPFLPDPKNPSALSTIRNPFTVTYQVTQWQVPSSGGSPLTVPANTAFAATQVTAAGNPYEYKRIDVTLRSATGPLGIGTRMAKVSGFINNAGPGANISVADPCPPLPATCP
ncbi:MAG TPA: prepilin-type N-terminal cleavage/methylation domain-containing protein [Thermoanaerobaculia bacterium]